ncbi:hypothetical protein TWF694_011587 [Orbilia ellipsospora]|uniref:Uncharacterized protein n=1 Tax=Orbilia ellipsospora TaxID=2528407 RepID=A0AAV9X5Q4_9PEZI
MSIQRTPTYDKSHYSWQPPSSQASESLIQDPGKSSTGGAEAPEEAPKTSGGMPDVSSYFHLPHQPADATEEDVALDSQPGLLKRSTFNYKQSSEEYKKKLEEEGSNDDDESFTPDAAAGGRRGSITSKPFKPSTKRTKSWDYRDKRGEMQMSMMQDDEGQGTGPGFSES